MPKSRITHPAISDLEKQKVERYDLLSYAAGERAEVEFDICYAQEFKRKKKVKMHFCMWRTIVNEQRNLYLELVSIKAAICLSKAILADYPLSSKAELAKKMAKYIAKMDADTEEVFYELMGHTDDEFRIGNLTIESMQKATLQAIQELQVSGIDDDELAL